MSTMKLKDIFDNPDEDLREYLLTKGKRHKCYKIYSNIKRISSWINDGFLYLSDGETWNDIDDKKKFNPDNSTRAEFWIVLLLFLVRKCCYVDVIWRDGIQWSNVGYQTKTYECNYK